MIVRIAVVVIALLVPSLGWSECAWVLWMNMAEFKRNESTAQWKWSGWQIEEAVPSLEECRTRVEAAYRRSLETASKGSSDIVGGATEVMVTHRATGAGFYRRSMCLPDTVDPRK
jgi:hypothetical protein